MKELREALSKLDRDKFLAAAESSVAHITHNLASDAKQRNEEIKELLTYLKQGEALVPPFTRKKWIAELEAAKIAIPRQPFKFITPMIKEKDEAQPVESEAVTVNQIWHVYDQTDKFISATCRGHFSARDLVRCHLQLCDVAQQVSLLGLTECVVEVSSLSTVRVTRATKCRFFLSTRQLRIHDTEDTDFIIAVASDPIIEGCRSLRFGPLGADPGPWDHVGDFDTATTTKRTWEIVPESERGCPQSEGLERLVVTVP